MMSSSLILCILHMKWYTFTVLTTNEQLPEEILIFFFSPEQFEVCWLGGAGVHIKAYCSTPSPTSKNYRHIIIAGLLGQHIMCMPRESTQCHDCAKLHIYIMYIYAYMARKCAFIRPIKSLYLEMSW